MSNLFVSLGPEVKSFLTAAFIIGPVSIFLLLLFLRQIERKDPNKIRWR